MASVPLCRAPAAIHPDHVAVEGQGLHDGSGLGPFAWLAGITQVLYGHIVPSLKWGKGPCMGTEPLLHPGVTLCMGLLSEVRLQSPFLPGLELPVLGWEEALHLAAKYDH